MNAFRTIRTFALVGLLAVIVFGIGAASADAGGKCYYGGGYSSSYCHTPTYNNCYYPSYNYCNYPTYDYSCFYPKTCSYPVTVFDCYGRPYTVWQTGYGQTGYGVASASFLP
jgi:hypothetical protein